MDRRTSIKWVLAASAAWPLLGRQFARAAPVLSARGYGTDPKLLAEPHVGELWPLTFSAQQRLLAGVLADLILPADDRSPSATAVGVVEFIDEWVSAPYPNQIQDRAMVLAGFTWLDAEASRRFGKDFVSVELAQQAGICDAIRDAAHAPAGMSTAARFFALFRDLTAGGFYSSPTGRKDLQYVGNVPLARFDGPPPELLKTLGL
jgi:hypothetical protein